MHCPTLHSTMISFLDSKLAFFSHWNLDVSMKDLFCLDTFHDASEMIIQGQVKCYWYNWGPCIAPNTHSTHLLGLTWPNKDIQRQTAQLISNSSNKYLSCLPSSNPSINHETLTLPLFTAHLDNTLYCPPKPLPLACLLISSLFPLWLQTTTRYYTLFINMCFSYWFVQHLYCG